MVRRLALIAALSALADLAQTPAAQTEWPTKDGVYIIQNFRFGTGESLPALKLHYLTLGEPHRNSAGHTDNAVLLLHGTGGSAQSLLKPVFSDVLFGPGQPLDIRKFFLILPDDIGHGQSSKPSDGLRMHFPRYDYDDMVAAQHAMLIDGLHVDHLRLILGTSMGCMQSFVWGETYPRFTDALAPFACLPIELAGRNRIWRYMAMQLIRLDPAWQNGDYTAEPIEGLRGANSLLEIAGSAPLQMQKNSSTRASADAYVDKTLETRIAQTDANDMLYYIDASRNYNPEPKLSSIVAPVLWINSADDFINPPELGIAEREVTKMPHARFILIPISDATRGHGTHTQAAVWKDHLVEFLRQTEPSAAVSRPAPPTRDPHTPGYVTAKEMPDGDNAPAISDGNFIIGPTHNPAPEMRTQDGVPRGTVFTFTMESADSKIFPGIARDPNTFGTPDPADPAKLTVITSHPAPYHRRVDVYVPTQYVPGTIAPFIVGADGPDRALFTALDNLIAAHRVPAMIAISIGNGGGDAQGSERGLEYDTMSGRYAEFVEQEVLPLVEKQYHVTLTKDPDGRATMGCSSGAAAAMSMAWFHPELYHRVLSYSGTYVNQQWPSNPESPHGAWEFHERLIPNTPAKPLRIWMEVGDRDLFNPNAMRDNMHDWVVGNENMARVLADKGYQYQFVFARNAGHCDRAVKEQTLPNALEYLWQRYPAGPGN